MAVFLSFVAVWTGSRLLASSQLVGVLLPGLDLLLTMVAYPLVFLLGHLVVRGVQRLVRSA